MASNPISCEHCLRERGLQAQATSYINDLLIWPDNYDSRAEEIAEMAYHMACGPRPPMGTVAVESKSYSWWPCSLNGGR